MPLLTSTDQDGSSMLYDDVSHGISLLISSPSRAHTEMLLAQKGVHSLGKYLASVIQSIP